MTSEVQIALNLVTGEQEHGKLITVDCRAFGRKNTIFLSRMKISFKTMLHSQKSTTNYAIERRIFTIKIAIKHFLKSLYVGEFWSIKTTRTIAD